MFAQNTKPQSVCQALFCVKRAICEVKMRRLRGCFANQRKVIQLLKYTAGLCIFISLTPAPAGAQSGQENAKGFQIESRPSGATVTIEGEIIGKTPCSFPYQLSGRYRLYAEKRGYETVSRDIDFGARKIETITFMLSPKTRKMAIVRSLFITGWGQNYTEQKLKSRIFLALQGSCLVSLGISHARCLRYKDTYESQLQSYSSASLQLDREPAAWQKLRASHDRWNEADRWRNAMLYAAAGVHALNLLDAIFTFPKKLRQIEILAAPATGQPAPEGAGFTISYCIPL
jgi:hypothetical protein